MIIVGSQRGGAKDLALHLLKKENDRVQVHELRGFVSDSLVPALQESYAISRGSLCKQHLFSVSFNPPKDADATTADFEDAINRVEKRMNLDGQPRAIVFHEKRGDDGELRRHAHAVWCRIDAETMRAKQLSFSKQKLNGIARDLYIEHGWTMPRGFLSHKDRDPRNFSLAEWQQAKRAKRDPRELKTLFSERWAISDSKAAFAAALEEQGFILARGDRRGYVAVDHAGEAYAIAKWCGVRTKNVSAKLGDPAALPDIRDARAKAAKVVTDRLHMIKREERNKTRSKLDRLAQEKRDQDNRARSERASLLKVQAERQNREATERDARLQKGLFGLLDRITGKRKKIVDQNLRDAEIARLRDRLEKQALADRHHDDIAGLRRQAEASKASYKVTLRELRDDIAELRKPIESERNARPQAEPKFSVSPDKPSAPDRAPIENDAVEAGKRKRTPTKDRPRRRSRSRNSPAPER